MSMLHSDPSLAEVPDFSPARLESLTRSVEQKKQRLEDDIRDYIRHKQDELRSYERQLLEQQRSMDHAESRREPDEQVEGRAHQPDAHNPPSSLPEPEPSTADASAGLKGLEPGQTAKRTKHNRVHKREKELCGLVTPIFLPLLDAGEASPVKKKKEKRKQREEKEKVDGAANFPPLSELGSPSSDAEKGKETRRSRNRNSEDRMDRGPSTPAVSEAKNETRKEEVEKKKSKRSAIKKSSLRHNGTPRSRRKRVSLVIDDQIVLPADNVIGLGTITSPSETATSSASNSTTSLDDLVDPRLVERVDMPIHQDPVHHSLPLHMSLPSTSPTKHTGHTLSESPAIFEEEQPQPQPAPHGASLEYSPPKAGTRTFLDPSPTANLDIPQYASATPMYSNVLELEGQPEEEFSSLVRNEEDFHTYVGGIDGSGVDNVNQAGSYGYPSSLGASYMESYMKNRPLSVRIATAEKAGLADREKQALIAQDKAREDDIDFDIGSGRVDEVDDDEGMDVIGSMEGF